MINNKYLEYFESSTKYSIHTKNRYIYDMKRLIAILSDNDILDMINTGLFYDLIDQSNYSDSTKLGMIKTVRAALLGVGDGMAPDILLEYNKYIESYDMLVKDALFEKRKEEVVMDFDDYLKKLEGVYGVDSKIYMIASMYYEVTMRDDFILKIVKQAPVSNNINYIVKNNKNMRLVINSYKTRTTYGQLIFTLSTPLTKAIIKYMDINKLSLGDYLFGEKPLSSYILYKNKTIGVSGGVSMYRHMRITKEKKVRTASEMIELAKEMAHSPDQQSEYLRNIV